VIANGSRRRFPASRQKVSGGILRRVVLARQEGSRWRKPLGRRHAKKKSSMGTKNCPVGPLPVLFSLIGEKNVLRH